MIELMASMALFLGLQFIQTQDFEMSGNEWQCANPKWTQGPRLDKNVFKGAIEAKCTFKTKSGGSFADLPPFLIGKIQQEAEKVHAGPKQEVYEKMPSQYLDVTDAHKSNGYQVKIRSDVHIATKDSSLVRVDTLSTRIDASGPAANLQKSDSQMFIAPGSTADEYDATFTGFVAFKKPTIAPAETFKREMVKAMEQEIRKKEQEIIESLREHL